MNTTNNDLYNETKLFVKHFVLGNEIVHNEIIITDNFNTRIAILFDIEDLFCLIRIVNINVDFYIKIFENNEIELKYRFEKENSDINNNNDLITNDSIKNIYFCIEEINKRNPIKRKILNIEKF